MDRNTVVAQLTPAQRSDYEERAAILEFDANIPRVEAERMALVLVLRATREAEGCERARE